MTAPAPPLPRRRRPRTRPVVDVGRASARASVRASSATAFGDTAIPIPSLGGRVGVAPAPDRPLRRSHPPRWASAPSPLAVTRPTPRGHTPRAPFVTLLLLLMGAGLMCLLLINTALAQNAFLVHKLQKSSAVLSDEEQTLSLRLDRLSDPANLAARATDLGMAYGGIPAYLPPGTVLPPGARVIDTDPSSGVVTILVPSGRAPVAGAGAVGGVPVGARPAGSGR
ncbi:MULTISPECIES: hypothetical protein [unclassified Frankia]|uniref:hypothetical protein n=1 Tax=unclassified Frankia TaxID=2632575 RepID=UPI002AD3186B|nr:MULTISPECIES: hypothetical protein [unclassified Frankia]